MSNILLITYGFPPDVGGAELVAYDYATNLAKLGHNISVVCRQHKSKSVQFNNFKVMEIPNLFGEKLWMLNLYIFFRKLNYEQYDHIILNQSNVSSVISRVLKEKDFNKCIPIVQGFEVEWFYKNKRIVSNIFNNYIFQLGKYHRKTLLKARKIVSVSNAHKNKVLKDAKLDFLDFKVQVVYTGIDKQVFHREFSSYRKDNSLEKRHLLFSVSRIVKMKGYEHMLAIFKQLVIEDPLFYWIIAGDGPYLSELKKNVKEANLSNYITFLGNVNRESLNRFYSIADCFWLLSDYDECLPLVYLEAQACGTPAIGRNKGGVVETIIDNKTGFLVNSDEECLDILLHRKYEQLKSEDLKSFTDKFDKIEAARLLIS